MNKKAAKSEKQRAETAKLKAMALEEAKQGRLHEIKKKEEEIAIKKGEAEAKKKVKMVRKLHLEARRKKETFKELRK